MNILLILFLFHHHSDNNQAILRYAESNVGRKVGNGICRELIDSAIVSTDKNFLKHNRSYYDDLKKIKRSQVKPGDIMLINYCDVDKMDGTKGFIVGHIAIVKEIHEFFVTVIEQNTSGAVNNSIVSESTHDLSRLHPRKNGGVYFCRFR